MNEVSRRPRPSIVYSRVGGGHARDSYLDIRPAYAIDLIRSDAWIALVPSGEERGCLMDCFLNQYFSLKKTLSPYLPAYIAVVVTLEAVVLMVR